MEWVVVVPPCRLRTCMHRARGNPQPDAHHRRPTMLGQPAAGGQPLGERPAIVAANLSPRLASLGRIERHDPLLRGPGDHQCMPVGASPTQPSAAPEADSLAGTSALYDN